MACEDAGFTQLNLKGIRNFLIRMNLQDLQEDVI